ncbi:hypothetical protein [Bacillus cereus]|uniref:hypothetical protein n=1 Tax=Bacillus cereus TaxID=1396 RepID=UPI001419DE36|nr:hypothetical protein [Bacillus cereus]
MLDQITWGTPGSLLCLGFFFAGLGIFLSHIRKINKNIPLLNKRSPLFTDGFFCLTLSY